MSKVRLHIFDQSANGGQGDFVPWDGSSVMKIQDGVDQVTGNPVYRNLTAADLTGITANNVKSDQLYGVMDSNVTAAIQRAFSGNGFVDNHLVADSNGKIGGVGWLDALISAFQQNNGNIYSSPLHTFNNNNGAFTGEGYIGINPETFLNNQRGYFVEPNLSGNRIGDGVNIGEHTNPPSLITALFPDLNNANWEEDYAHDTAFALGGNVWRLTSGDYQRVVHDGANGVLTATETGLSSTPDSFVGGILTNETDGSFGFITANGANTYTVASLQGGTNNTISFGDAIRVTKCNWMPGQGSSELRIHQIGFDAGGGTYDLWARVQKAPYTIVNETRNVHNVNEYFIDRLVIPDTFGAGGVRHPQDQTLFEVRNHAGLACLIGAEIMRTDLSYGSSVQGHYSFGGHSLDNTLAYFNASTNEKIGFFADQGVRRQLDLAPAVEPKVNFWINSGMNERSGSQTKETYKNNSQAIMDKLLAACAAKGIASQNVSFVLMPSHRESHTSDNSLLQQYREADREIALERDNTAMIDLGWIMDPAGGNITDPSYYADASHLTNIGHLAVADDVIQRCFSNN